MDNVTFNRRASERFVALALAQTVTKAGPAPPAIRHSTETILTSVPPAVLCPDAPADTELRHRAHRAADLAYAQAGEDGVQLLQRGLRRLAQLAAEAPVLHGTGSWALRGILRDGWMRASGDGMSGEVAITSVWEPDVFVILWKGPLSLYCAAAFAYMNAGYQRDAFQISARRAGREPVGEFVSELLFGDAEGPFVGPHPQFENRLTRYRLASRDAFFHQAQEALARLVASGDGTAATRPLQRRIAVTDPESALDNLLFAVQHRMQTDPALTRRPEAERFASAARWVAERLRGQSLFVAPGDTPAERERKEHRCRALRHQYPVLLLIDPKGLDCRVEPNYPWADERRVEREISARAIKYILVPDIHVKELRSSLTTHGLAPEVLPLEYFEGLRLFAESVSR